jgi:hypothetical protein
VEFFLLVTLVKVAMVTLKSCAKAPLQSDFKVYSYIWACNFTQEILVYPLRCMGNGA